MFYRCKASSLRGPVAGQSLCRDVGGRTFCRSMASDCDRPVRLAHRRRKGGSQAVRTGPAAAGPTVLNGMESLAFSPDDKRVAGGAIMAVVIWDADPAR